MGDEKSFIFHIAQLLQFQTNKFLSVFETEIWDFKYNQNSQIEPTLRFSDGYYAEGMGLYFVPENFCHKGDKHDYSDSFTISFSQ